MKGYTDLLEYKRAKLLQKRGHKSLKDITQLLQTNNIFYWIDAGTLLGIVRDESFIDGDTDIDIAIVIDDPEKLYNLLQDNNYNIWYYYDNEENRKKLIRAEKYKVGIDFEIMEKNNDKYYYDSPRKSTSTIKSKNSNKHSVMRFEFEEKIIKSQAIHLFKNIKLNIPSNYNEYFLTYYQNWKIKIPKKKFLNIFFKNPVNNYRHHNNRAYYKKDNYLYYNSVSQTTIYLTFIDKIFYLLIKLIRFF